MQKTGQVWKAHRDGFLWEKNKKQNDKANHKILKQVGLK